MEYFPSNKHKAEKILLDYDDDVNNKSADELKNLIELELFLNKKRHLKKENDS